MIIIIFQFCSCNSTSQSPPIPSPETESRTPQTTSSCQQVCQSSQAKRSMQSSLKSLHMMPTFWKPFPTSIICQTRIQSLGKRIPPKIHLTSRCSRISARMISKIGTCLPLKCPDNTAKAVFQNSNRGPFYPASSETTQKFQMTKADLVKIQPKIRRS